MRRLATLASMATCLWNPRVNTSTEQGRSGLNCRRNLGQTEKDDRIELIEVAERTAEISMLKQSSRMNWIEIQKLQRVISLLTFTLELLTSYAGGSNGDVDLVPRAIAEHNMHRLLLVCFRNFGLFLLEIKTCDCFGCKPDRPRPRHKLRRAASLQGQASTVAFSTARLRYFAPATFQDPAINLKA